MSTDARARIIISATTAEASAALKSLGKDMQGVTGAATQGSRGWVSALSDIRVSTVVAMAAVTAGLAAARKGYQATVGELMSYAREVRQLSTITGQSAEDTSRLVQVFGDFNIETGQVTAAMRIMRQQGLVPTMDSIAQLSDRYLALAPGIERVNFLQTTFGRGGAEFALVLEQGSAALRARAATVESGLVLTQQQLDQTEELRQAQDDLSDAGKSLALVVGSALVPAVLAFTKTAINAITPARDLNRQWQLTNRSLAESTPNYRDYVRAVRDAAEANRISAQAGREFYIQSVQNGTLTEDQARALGILTEAQWQELRAEQALGDDRREGILALRQIRLAIDDTAAAEERLAAMQDEAAASMQGLADSAAAMWGGAESSIDSFITSSIAAIDFMLTQGPEWMAAGEAIRDAVMANVITPEQGRAYFQEMEIARQAMMTELSSPEEWAAARAVATEWGIPFWKALQDIRAARLEAENFPRNIETIINFRTVGAWTTQERLTGVSGQGGGGGGGSYSAASVAAANLAATRESYGGAAGGPIHPITEVGELGTEGIINGMIIPHGEWTAMKRAGLIPTRRAQGGGDFYQRAGGAAASYVHAQQRRQWVVATHAGWYNTPGAGETPMGGTATSAAQAAVTAAVTQAAVQEANAPMEAALAVMPQALGAQIIEPMRTQANAITKSNNELAGLLQDIRLLLTRQATDGGIGRAVRDNMQAAG